MTNNLIRKMQYQGVPKPAGTLSCGVPMGEIEPKDVAQDGGPGSGNFGHKGRPGKVGGSGPGGGSQYRGGRSDIGYFGTRKDWLNGLQGEPQHKAVRFLAEAKRKLESAIKTKEFLMKALPVREYNKTMEGQKVEGIEKMTPEEYIMYAGTKEEKGELIEHMSKARKWEQNKQKLMDENLSDDEKKAFEYLDRNFNRLGDTAKNEFFDLKGKAMGVNVSPELSEQTLVGSGLKEPPKPPEPEKPKELETDYEWYHKDMAPFYGAMEDYMASAMGTTLSGNQWFRMNGVEKMNEFKKLNKSFMNFIKHDRLSPSKARFALGAIRRMRDKISMEHDPRGNFWYESQFKVTPEMVDRLSEDEQSRLLRIMNAVEYNMHFNYEDPYKSLEGLNGLDFDRIDDGLKAMELRTKKEQDIVREYILLQEKMLTGDVPEDDSYLEEERRKKKEEAKAKEQERIRVRDYEQAEFEKSDKSAAKKAAIEKIKAFDSSRFYTIPVENISKTVKDLGYFREGSQFVTSPLVAPVVYRDAAKAYKDTIDRFPFMAGEFGGFGDSYTRSKAIMGCNKNAYSFAVTEIITNYSHLGDEDTINRRDKQGIDQGWYSKTDSNYGGAYHSIIHEIGHSVANWLHRYAYGSFKPVKLGNGYAYDNEVADLIKKRVFKAMGMTPNAENISREVSKYASASRLNKGVTEIKNGTKSDEFFAECFAEMMCTKEHRPIIAEFERQLNKFIEENGITAMKTATTGSTMPRFDNYS